MQKKIGRLLTESDGTDPAGYGIETGIQVKTENSREEESDIRRGTDHSRSPRPSFTAPYFIHQGNTESPFPAHPKRSNKAKSRELPRFGHKGTKPCEDRKSQDCKGHGPDSTELVPEPTKKNAPCCSTDEKDRNDDREPLPLHRRSGSREQILKRWFANQREKTHLETVEKPTEEGSKESGVGPARLGFRMTHFSGRDRSKKRGTLNVVGDFLPTKNSLPAAFIAPPRRSVRLALRLALRGVSETSS